MEKFSFGRNAYPLNFTIDNEKIYLVDELDSFSNLSDEQKWHLNHNAVICEVQISGRKTEVHTGDRHICCSESASLKYVSHEITQFEYGEKLEIIQRNDICEVRTYYLLYKDANVIRSYSIIKNISKEKFTLEYISSFVKYGVLDIDRFDKATLSIPSNSWFMECQWKKSTLQELGIIAPNNIKTFKAYKVNNTGMWSTKNYLPMGLIEDVEKNNCQLFQIEANGSWSYEIGDFTNTVTLNLSGPTLEENGWMKHLLPNEEFETVKVALTKTINMNEAFNNITKYRRMICNRLTDKSLPIIFNEYMFASWNDPSFETALSLAPVAKELGADYFVIDCGWHDEEPNPFYHVGKWEESKTKYPDGLMKTLDYVRSLGLKVGLWLEPEVVGYFGNAKDLWTDDCFFQRNGKPLIISNRYQLDFRNEYVYKTLMNKITNICEKYKIDYFKFDYNIEPGIGTDLNSDSLGDGLLENNRCYKRFIDELGSKFPNLVIESCASGGNRLDYSTLDNVNLASTSDQTDYKLYPYIISNLLTAILPEQAGVWSYPRSENMNEEDIDLECIAMNMINSMIGRVHLASKLYLLDQEKQKMIKDGIDCYNYLKQFRENCVPYYPIGLSDYKDKHLAFGYQTEKKAILFLYNMSSDEDINIKLEGIKSVKILYPLDLETQYNFENELLTLKSTRHLIARVFELDK